MWRDETSEGRKRASSSSSDGSCLACLPSSIPWGPSERWLTLLRCAENFLPKVDGVTRTLARLLEHLHNEGHAALLCGPETGMVSRKGRLLLRKRDNADI